PWVPPRTSKRRSGGCLIRQGQIRPLPRKRPCSTGEAVPPRHRLLGRGGGPPAFWPGETAATRDKAPPAPQGQAPRRGGAAGPAAWVGAQEAVPDLILADVMMPGLDGFGLLRQLRADPRTRQVPVVLLSARAGEESRVEGMEAGADDYLVKPFSARELL